MKFYKRGFIFSFGNSDNVNVEIVSLSLTEADGKVTKLDSSIKTTGRFGVSHFDPTTYLEINHPVSNLDGVDHSVVSDQRSN